MPGLTDKRRRSNIALGVVDSGILDDEDQDRLADALLWHEQVRYRHPFWWLGTTFVEYDLDSPSPGRTIQLDPNTPTIAHRQVWPPLRTWAAGRVLVRHRASAVAQFFPQSPIIVTGGNPQNGKTEAGQMRNMQQLLGFPDNRIIVEDKANSMVQNAQFSVPLAKQSGTSGIILVTSTTRQGRADGDFVDAGRNLLATVSYPDGNPSVNVTQFAHDAISPFVNVG